MVNLRNANPELATCIEETFAGGLGRAESLADDESSRAVLNFLLECSLAAQPVRRREGDPQLQQLGMWLAGVQANRGRAERTVIVDVGAGHGDLLDAITRSGCAAKLIYVPVEPDESRWEAITNRARSIPESARLVISDIESCTEGDIVCFVNVLHELEFAARAGVLSAALNLVKPTGVVVIHEVAVLPHGEAGFVMWDKEDVCDVLRIASIRAEITAASTMTRPNGWPLETICINPLSDIPSASELEHAMMSSLDQSLQRWTEKLEQHEGGQDPKDAPYKGFLMAQVANLNVWKQKHLRSSGSAGHIA